MTGRRAALTATLIVAGCGGGAVRLPLFSTDWQDDRGASIGRVWTKVSGVAAPAQADVAVGVARGGGLIGVALDGTGRTWSFEHPLDARPVVAANVVVGSGGGEAFAIDASDGHLLWKRSAPGLRLVGAGDDGATTVATFAPTGAGGSTLFAVRHDGHLLQQIQSDNALGAPAALAGLAFVPWAGEYVSVVDLATGEETARVTLREQTSRAWTQAGALWFAGLGLIRFDERIRDASSGGASTVNLPPTGVPGNPKWTPDMAPLPVAADAQDSVRLYARPAAGEGAAIEGGRFYATYFRLAMGFDASGGNVQWVMTHEATFLGGAAARGGLVLCDDKGAVLQLDERTGAAAVTADFGRPLQACVVSVEAIAQSAAPNAAPLVQQIQKAVTTPDAQLVEVQKMLLPYLTKAEDESVTRTLIELAESAASPELQSATRDALAKRRNGAQEMLDALAEHYDYLKDTVRLPPVGPLADALAAMNDKSAAPLLAAQLLDPQDSPDDVRRAAAALVSLAGREEATALRRFFGMYRATADDDDIASAVVSVAKALLALQDHQGMAEVKAAVDSGLTTSAVRDQLATLDQP